jgi:hypothetical protein
MPKFKTTFEPDSEYVQAAENNSSDAISNICGLMQNPPTRIKISELAKIFKAAIAAHNNQVVKVLTKRTTNSMRLRWMKDLYSPANIESFLIEALRSRNLNIILMLINHWTVRKYLCQLPASSVIHSHIGMVLLSQPRIICEVVAAIGWKTLDPKIKNDKYIKDTVENLEPLMFSKFKGFGKALNRGLQVKNNNKTNTVEHMPPVPADAIRIIFEFAVDDSLPLTKQRWVAAVPVASISTAQSSLKAAAQIVSINSAQPKHRLRHACTA